MARVDRLNSEIMLGGYCDPDYESISRDEGGLSFFEHSKKDVF